jgi:hypothetical protein
MVNSVTLTNTMWLSPQYPTAKMLLVEKEHLWNPPACVMQNNLTHGIYVVLLYIKNILAVCTDLIFVLCCMFLVLFHREEIQSSFHVSCNLFIFYSMVYNNYIN